MKSLKNINLMKAALILVAAFWIQLSTVSASAIGEVVASSDPRNLSCPECLVLAPSVPMEAFFSESLEFASPMNLNPTVPMNADFNEELVLLTEPGNNLSPVVPSTAEFSDSL